jgi:hypothetical protein
MESLKEATKEFFRIVVLAIIPVVIIGLDNGTIDIKLIAVTGLVAGLKFIDKYMHEVGKESGDESMTKGITRF